MGKISQLLCETVNSVKINEIFLKYKNMTPAIKASIWFMICSILQKGISFITVPIFTRLLSIEEYGQYSMLLSLESIASIFITLNLSYQVFNNGMVKFDKDKNGYTTSMVGLTLLTGGIAWIVFCLFNGFFQGFTEIKFEYIGFLFVDILFNAIIGLWIVRQRYEFKYRSLTLVTLVSAVLNPLIGILLVTMLEDKVGARLISTVFANLFVFIFVFAGLIKKSKKIISHKYWKYALKLDLPLIPHYLSMVLLNNTDRLMIGKLCGSGFTAIYSVANNAAMIMQIVVVSINSSFNPWLYSQLKDKNFSTIKRNTNYLLILVALVSIIPVLFAPEMILLLGSEQYFDAVSIMPALSCCVFLIFVYTLFTNIEMFYERTKFIFIGSLSATTINIIFNFIFIQLFGYKAAAYITLVCYLLLALFHYLMMKRVCKENEITEDIFNIQYIFVLTLGVILVAFVFGWLSNYLIIRAVIFFLVLTIAFIQREKLLTFFKSLK